MARPIIGIISNHHVINDEYEVQAAGIINISAIAEVADGVPMLIPDRKSTRLNSSHTVTPYAVFCLKKK